MKFVKFLSVVSAAALLYLGVAFTVNADDASTANSQIQSQPRATARSTAQRRNYRAYSYEPSRGGDVARRASSPTWSRADSKVKFRYGYYPY